MPPIMARRHASVVVVVVELAAHGYCVQRTLAALEALADRGPLGASALADALAINPRTARRLLGAMVAAGWVQNGPGAPYRLTHRLQSVAERARQGRCTS